MTRQEAHIIAEEFFKLCEKNKVFPDRYMNVNEAAEFLRLQPSTLYKKLDEVPHTKTGGTLRFSERALRKYIERTN